MGYTDEIVQAWDLKYGTTAYGVSGAEEIAAGLLGRALTTAEIGGEHGYLFSRQILNTIGREIILQGESLWKYEGGGLVWQMNADVAVEFNLMRFAQTIDWQTGRGVSALQCAPTLKKLVKQVELGIERESRATPYYLTPVPYNEDQANSLWKKLKSLLLPREPDDDADEDKTIAGATQSLVQGEQAGGITGYQATGNFTQRRLGIDTPPHVMNLMIEVQKTALFAMGVPSPVVYPADANSQRESWRIYLVTVVESISKIIVSEAARIGLSLTLSFPELKSSDVAARARSFRELVQAGMTTDQAAAISGLMLETVDA